MPRYTWRRLEDKQEFPPALADLIREAHILVKDGSEWAGVFIHDEGRCWAGWRRADNGEAQSRIFPSPDEAVTFIETVMDVGLLAPRRRARV